MQLLASQQLRHMQSPQLIADYFRLAAHHEKGGCTPARTQPIVTTPSPPYDIYF